MTENIILEKCQKYTLKPCYVAVGGLYLVHVHSIETTAPGIKPTYGLNHDFA